MPKVIVSVDGVVIEEVAFTQERIELGRRPCKEIVIDNLAISRQWLHGGEWIGSDPMALEGSDLIELTGSQL